MSPLFKIMFLGGNGVIAISFDLSFT
jgi:hypothetical protein